MVEEVGGGVGELGGKLPLCPPVLSANHHCSLFVQFLSQLICSGKKKVQNALCGRNIG